MRSPALLPVLPGLREVKAEQFYVHLRQLGALGDGRQDATDLLRAALARLPRADQNSALYGGTVYLPGGTYLVKETIVIPERVSLLGEHLSRVRVQAAAGFTGPVLQVEGEYTRVENLQIWGNEYAVDWRGALSSTLVNAELRASECPLRLRPGCRGMFHNLVLRGGGFGVQADRPAQVAFSGLTVEGTGRGGLVIRGGGCMSVQALTYLGPGRAVSALGGSRVAVIGASAGARSGEEACYCDRDSLLYAAALSAPGYRLVVLDESGDTARLAGPTVGLYTGQATVLSSNDKQLQPLRQVRVNCGGGAVGDFAADFGFTSSAMAYGDPDSDQQVDLSHIKQAPAPRRVYLTERSGHVIEYDFPMVAGKYRVRLHLCEIYFTAPPGRGAFRILINGQEVAPKVDVLATTGAKFAPLVLEFANLQPQGGKFNLRMEGLMVNTPDGRVERGSPTISAIEILPQEGGAQ